MSNYDKLKLLAEVGRDNNLAWHGLIATGILGIVTGIVAYNYNRNLAEKDPKDKNSWMLNTVSYVTILAGIAAGFFMAGFLDQKKQAWGWVGLGMAGTGILALVAGLYSVTFSADAHTLVHYVINVFRALAVVIGFGVAAGIDGVGFKY